MAINVEGEIPDLPTSECIRLVSFNINGYKTLSHYHPWNTLNKLSEIFTYLKADIITFQELKLQRSDISKDIASVTGFTSFITIPQTKRGYSGVAVFVKNDLHGLKVTKVEEGITGYLNLYNEPTQNYRKKWDLEGESGISIGGYTDNLVDWKEGQRLDSNGRCIVVELNNKMVIISVYCPANSMGSEVEEQDRCLFLETLFKRAENLQRMGKNVIIMGDINVAPSLIDRDDVINEGLKEGTLRLLKNRDADFELVNKEKVIEFRNSTPARRILHDYLYDYNEFDKEKNKEKILYDLGRSRNRKRLKMYTCWNTLLNNRPMNIGSRIDLFLGTKTIEENIQDCNIWSFLYGSDHCPIYCDINISDTDMKDQKPKLKHFEAMSYYGLKTSKSIDSFFKPKPSKNATESKPPSPKANSESITKRSSTTPSYMSRKKQRGQLTLISVLNKKNREREKRNSGSLFVYSDEEFNDDLGYSNSSDCNNRNNGNTNNNNNNIGSDNPTLQTETTHEEKSPKLTSLQFANMLKENSGVIPRCGHDELCVLRLAKRGSNAGKKFWCCSRPPRNATWAHDHNEDNADESQFQCKFFKWATR